MFSLFFLNLSRSSGKSIKLLEMSIMMMMSINIRSYMSVLLNLLNKLRKEIKCEAC